MKGLVMEALTFGNRAQETLQKTVRGRVNGLVSGGIYLRTVSDQILFLSFAHWRGPLTINLPPGIRIDLSVTLHSPFQIADEEILFQEEGIAIKSDQAVRWAAQPRLERVLPQQQRSQIYALVAARVSAGWAERDGAGPDSGTDLQAWLAPESQQLTNLRIAVDSRNPSWIVDALATGLGSGPGLTPAGDDIAQGFLLALNRWGDQLCPHLSPEKINPALVEAARQRTTTLSANLIESAAAGQADERLLTSLDGLVSGGLAEDSIVERLLAWGHTSGTAALQGMGLLLS